MTKNAHITGSPALIQEHKKTPSGMVFYTNLGEMRAERSLRPYLHLIEKAWDSLGMKRDGGVLCVEGLPTVL